MRSPPYPSAPRFCCAERWAGYAVVLAIFVSACVALVETIDRLIHPQELSHLWAFAGAGVIGFLGNEIAASVRLRAGRRLDSPALVVDGKHARVDGFVSLGVIASAALVALGWQTGDPIVGLLITLVILKVTSDSWRIIRAGAPRPRRLGRDLPNAPAWFNNAGDGKNVAGGQALPSPDQYSPRRAREEETQIVLRDSEG